MKSHILSVFHYLLILSLIHSCGQGETGDKSEPLASANDKDILYQSATNEIYELIDAVVKVDSLRPFGSLNIRLLDSLPADSYVYKFLDDTVLLKSYSKFNTYSGYLNEFKNELKNFKPYHVRQPKLSDLKIFPADSVDFNKPFDENRDVAPFYLIYSPLISADDQVAVISIDLVCFGLCGEGWSLILKKENGNWVKVGRILRWIS